MPEKVVILTTEQIRILLSLTGPRVAMPDAEKFGDWSIDMQRRLLEAKDA